MDRTEVNASPVQKALQGIKKYKYVLLTALLGVLLLLLPQNEKAADTGSATPSAAETFTSTVSRAVHMYSAASLSRRLFGRLVISSKSAASFWCIHW